MIEECVSLLLEPIVRFCIRRSIGIQKFLDSAKRTYARIAIEELKRSGRETTLSSVKLITGLHRRDVKRILDEPAKPETAIDIVSKVIGQWRTDKEFTNSRRVPKVLSIEEGEKSDFYKLVRKVSRDVYPRTVLSELERKEAIEYTPKGIKLTSEVNPIRKANQEGYQMLGRHVSEAMTAIEENLNHLHRTPNLHARTYFDNISTHHLPQIREWLLNEGSEFHHRVRDYLAQYDLDLNPKKSKVGGVKIAVSSFGKIYEDGS